MTIHKSQGKTIEKLKIDFEGIFENGQGGSHDIGIPPF